MKLPQKIRGAIFDLDGTLLDSLEAWKEVDSVFFARRNMPLPRDYFSAVKTMDLPAAALYTKERFSLPDSASDMIREWRELIREEYALHVNGKRGAFSFLQSLKADGVRLAVATSSDPELFLPALKRLKLDSFFSAFCTTKDSRGKEFPDVYLCAAQKLNLSPGECAVFEDIPEGILSAKAGGFFTVAVFDPHSADQEELLRRSADLFLRDFGEDA